MKVTAQQRLYYGGQLYIEGQSFEADGSDPTTKSYLRSGAVRPAAAAATVTEAASVTGPKRYPRRDLRAEGEGGGEAV